VGVFRWDSFVAARLFPSALDVGELFNFRGDFWQ
jgi:hypothetical protein